ncbi:Two-component system sensor histidine kinase [hydrothermal vent metagenome]|uniref:histidine kinase n=1 Tax=hydrothermal vent metagenome TaxID=652676 RepID=A0A3B0X9J6_9ZZZZ
MKEYTQFNKAQLMDELQRLHAENTRLKDMYDNIQLSINQCDPNLAEQNFFVNKDSTECAHIKESLQCHHDILIAVAGIAQNFQTANGWEKVVDISLKQLGRAASVSRVYLFKNHEAEDGEPLCSQLYEQCAENITAQINRSDCRNLNWYKRGLGHWYEDLSLGKVVMRKRSTYTRKEKGILDDQQILSVLVVPLFVRGQFWGFMGFDDCLDERNWSSAEIASLKSAAVVISGAIGREQVELEMRASEEMRLSQAEKQRDELVREVHHRIKNHLQGLMGLLKQRKNQGRENRAIIDEAISQIESVALVYGLQSAHRDAKIYFSQMMNAIVHSMKSLSHIPFLVTQGNEKGSCEVDRSKAVALALVINEMLMNAIKHFQSDKKDAKIKIHHEHGYKSIALFISNPGCLPDGVDLQKERGLGTGLELAKSMLPSEGAKLFLENKDNAVVAKLLISPPLLVNM